MTSRTIVAFLLTLASSVAVAQGQLNLYCSSPNTAWCQGVAVAFEKSSGTRVAVIQKATGEMLAQIKAEKENPKGDVWWAGASDAYMQAAEEGLLETYRSPNVERLYDWAQRITTLSKDRVSGVYGGIVGIGYNTEVIAKKKLPIPQCWKDLVKPVYKNEIMLGNPSSSGTAYLMLATLVQVFGEDEAFRFLRELHPNVNQYARSGIGPMTAVSRGETALGSTVLHGVIQDIMRGFPVEPVLPCEGVGYEIGSTAIIKGTRNVDAAKKFVDFLLSAEGQKVGLDVKEFAIPTNRSLPLPPQIPRLTDVKVIDYDFARFGSSAERKRLLERWEKEINSAPK
ncbi:MAG TPA: ABC transporter substrate-binding protein [Casimicrobiaceae bacterium]|nr:ABC transporter substrate-binding protein [Casimicrobiaceae bacterium]